MLRGQRNRFRVDRHEPIEIVLVGVGDRRRRLGRTRIVDEDVQPPETFHGGRNHSPRVGLGRDVRLHEDCANILRDGAAAVRPAIDEHDLGAFLRKPPADGGSET